MKKKQFGMRATIKAMKTPRFLSLSFLIILVLFSHFTTYAQQHKSKPPNIIFILVDDQGYGDVGVFWQNQRACKGLPHERSPYLDQMAEEGAMLTQQYAAAPVCAPSRASLVEGVSQGHTRVRDNKFDKAIADNYTMASTLKKLGYSTAAIGKWGLQGDKRWDENGASWPARPSKRGFDYFFGYMRHSDGHEHYPKEGKYGGKKQVWMNGENIVNELDKCYTADLWTAAAKHWIVQHMKKDKDQPFFMYLAYDTPHAVDELPTQKYPVGGGLHGGVQWIGESHHFINTASGTIDSYIHPDYANATYDNDHNPNTPEIPWPETYKRYATANRRLDYAVGDILKLLKNLKIDSNTLVIYTSDNGPSIETYLGKWQKEKAKHLPAFFSSYGPFDGIKRDNWEGGLRMPTIVRWPGHISKRKVTKDPSIFYDWAPTFIQAAGSSAPARMDGTSLLSTLTGKGSPLTSTVFVDYYHGGKTPHFKEFASFHRGRRRREMQTIRFGDYVGVRYDIKSADDDFEIYNVLTDPQEKYNLAQTPDKKVTILAKQPFQSIGEPKSISIRQLEKHMKARVLQLRRPLASNPRHYDTTLIAPVQAKVKQGLRWEFFNGDFPWIPQVINLKSESAGEISQLDINKIQQDKKGIFYFYGYIRTPKDGEYTFYLTADTKAFLRIYDAQAIDEDFGYKGGVEKKATFFLKTGLHPFRMYYKWINEKPELNFKWSGPGIKKQSILGKVFFRNQTN